MVRHVRRQAHRDIDAGILQAPDGLKASVVSAKRAFVSTDNLEERLKLRLDFLPGLKGGDSLDHAVSWFEGGSH